MISSLLARSPRQNRLQGWLGLTAHVTHTLLPPTLQREGWKVGWVVSLHSSSVSLPPMSVTWLPISQSVSAPLSKSDSFPKSPMML